MVFTVHPRKLINKPAVAIQHAKWCNTGSVKEHVGAHTLYSLAKAQKASQQRCHLNQKEAYLIWERVGVKGKDILSRADRKCKPRAFSLVCKDRLC